MDIGIDTRIYGSYCYHTDHLGSAAWATKGNDALPYLHSAYSYEDLPNLPSNDSMQKPSIQNKTIKPLFINEK